MGRGRAKAKQTKVARDLKYNAQDMDLDRLTKELHGEVYQGPAGLGGAGAAAPGNGAAVNRAL